MHESNFCLIIQCMPINDDFISNIALLTAMKLLRKINSVITSGLIIHIIKSVIQTNVSHK